MNKVICTLLIVIFMVSALMQGQVVYTCHTEDSIHLISSCYDVVEDETKCCDSSIEKRRAQLKETCCLESEIGLLNSLSCSESERLKGHSEPSDSFHVSCRSIYSSIDERSLSVNTLFNNSPPRTQRQLYVKICSFLC